MKCTRIARGCSLLQREESRICDVHLFSEKDLLIKFADRGARGEDQDGDVDAQGEGERDSFEINLQLPLINC